MEIKQAKLLQIGDIVIKDENSKDAVSYLDFEGLCCTISLVKDRRAFSPDEIEQIPLTSEILEKNGFVDTEKITKIGFGDFKVYQNKSIFDITERNNLFYYHSITFETVDKLQRFLRLKGYVDFANNFKV